MLTLRTTLQLLAFVALPAAFVACSSGAANGTAAGTGGTSSGSHATGSTGAGTSTSGSSSAGGGGGGMGSSSGNSSSGAGGGDAGVVDDDAGALNFPGVTPSPLFEVRVTQNNLRKQNFVYVSKAATTQGANNSNGWWDGQLGKTFSYSIFSGPGPYTVEVTKLGSTAKSATIRPNRLGLGTIPSTVDSTGSVVTFTLPAPAQVSVEFDDDPTLTNALALMAQPPEAPGDVPDTTQPNVYSVTQPMYSSFSIPSSATIVYFTPGAHQIGSWTIPSNVTQVYFAEGAFVRGYLYSDRTTLTTGIKINGRGVLSADVYPYQYMNTSFMLDVRTSDWSSNSSGNVIEGIALVDSSLYTCDLMGTSSTVQNVLFHGFQIQNDGLHIVGKNNTVKNNFFHVNDDNITIPLRNDGTVFTNNVFWGLTGGNTMMMLYQVHDENNITFEHSDLIHGEWPPGTVGAMINADNAQANPNDPNPVFNGMTVKDINVDTPIKGLVDMRMIHPGYTHPVTYENFTFTDIHMDHQGTVSTTVPLLYFDGTDATHSDINFTFTNFTINGTVVTQTSPLLPSIMQLDGTVTAPTFN